MKCPVLCSIVLPCSTLLLCGGARAEEPSWDPGNPTVSSLPGEAGVSDERVFSSGVYGRFAGDVTMSAAAGAELGHDPARALLKLAAHYYWMAGPYLSLRSPPFDSDDGFFIASAGIDLKPVFIPRWAMDLERGPAFVDLLIDSLAVSAGSFVGLGEHPGPSRPAGFELGLGAGIPLLAAASGPWFEARYLLSWQHSGGATASCWLSLSWHFMANTPLSSQTAE